MCGRVGWVLAGSLKSRDDRIATLVTRVSDLERELAGAKAAARPLELEVDHLKQEKTLLADENKWLNEQLQAKVVLCHSRDAVRR